MTVSAFSKTCGARSKRSGQPCQLTSIYNNGRCKFHGGLSTGPRTIEGKARSSMNACSKNEPHEGGKIPARVTDPKHAARAADDLKVTTRVAGLSTEHARPTGCVPGDPHSAGQLPTHSSLNMLSKRTAVPAEHSEIWQVLSWLAARLGRPYTAAAVGHGVGVSEVRARWTLQILARRGEAAIVVPQGTGDPPSWRVTKKGRNSALCRPPDTNQGATLTG